MGIFRADDASLLVLQTEIDLWAAQLPVQWPYSPTLDTPDAADLINAFRVVLEVRLFHSCQNRVDTIVHITQTFHVVDDTSSSPCLFPPAATTLVGSCTRRSTGDRVGRDGIWHLLPRCVDERQLRYR